MPRKHRTERENKNAVNGSRVQWKSDCVLCNQRWRFFFCSVQRNIACHVILVLLLLCSRSIPFSSIRVMFASFGRIIMLRVQTIKLHWYSHSTFHMYAPNARRQRRNGDGATIRIGAFCLRRIALMCSLIVMSAHSIIVWRVCVRVCECASASMDALNN